MKFPSSTSSKLLTLEFIFNLWQNLNMKFLFLVVFFLASNIEAKCYIDSLKYSCYADGRLYYSGEMRDSNQANAMDSLYYSTGSFWKYLNLTGNGTYYHKNGDRYEGNFIDNKRYGYGTFFFEDGRKYVGNFKDGKYDGYGRFYFSNNKMKYSGNYFNSERSGRGTEYDKDEKVVYIGNWKNGKYHGQGTKYYYGSNWASVTGKYISGDTFGIMEVLYQPDNEIQYKKGEIYCCNDDYYSWHGKVETKYKNGAELEEHYSEGKRTKFNWITTNEEANKKILENQKLEKIRKEQLALKQKERQRKIKREEDIYNQCILDKVPDAKTDTAAELIKSSCREISKNPTRWQIIKYLGYEGLQEILN